jgi:tetrapyrrole methylase family protein / MazG family protein
MSYAPPSFEGTGVDPVDGSQVVDAERLVQQHYPAVDVCQPLLIGRLCSRALAAGVRRTLANAYPDDHEAVVIQSPDTPVSAPQRVALRALDQIDAYGPATSLYVPPLPPGSSFASLQEIVAHLRAPEGCPWDREQTLASLRHDLLGECVEALEAIDLDASGEDNSAHIAEELGDVMLVVTMMVQIAAEERRFRMADVMHHIVTKLIRRHPHVFGDTSVDGAAEVTANWEAIKAQERAAKGQPGAPALDGVPAHLPALEKARKVQSKAAKAGLLDRAALARSIPELTTLIGPEPDERTVGELLWTLTALAAEHGINAENALRAYAVQYRKQQEGEGQDT